MPAPIFHNQLTNLTLITGGARSGKSAFAEKMAASSAGQVVYIATMSIGRGDDESVVRVNRHKSRRPELWRTIEEPVHLAREISSLPSDTSVCLIDCLSLWLANLLPQLDEDQPSCDLPEIERSIDEDCSRLLEAIAGKPTIQFIIVTNEVGSGIVPANVVARVYRDLLGTLNQTVARASERVWLCCVGLQLALKA